MVDDGIFATNAEIIAKAGKNADATAIAVGWTDAMVAQVESRINNESEYNWSDNYAGLNVDVKGTLTEAESNLMALYIVNYNPNVWTIATASFKRDTLKTEYTDCIKMLREKDKGQIFIIDA